MTTLFNRSPRLLALLIAALLGAGPLLADPGDKHGDKGAKHAQKQAEKADKHAEKRAEKSEKHAQKRAEKADKQADKFFEQAAKRGEKADEREAKYAEKADKRARERQQHADVRIGGYFDDRHRHAVRSYYTQHYGNGRGCPPGLAKKNNGCMPPGQAKKWAVGQPLPAGVVIYAVPQPVLVRLPPPPAGYRYARVGDDIVLVQARNHIVVDIIYDLFG